MPRRVLILLGLLLAAPAGASVVTVKIDAEGAEAPFVVQLSGRYAGVHDTSSRHWRNALVKAGGRRPILVGPVNPLLNVGVWATLYHPGFLRTGAKVDHTPYLLWPASFDPFEPHAWADFLRTGTLPEKLEPFSANALFASHLDEFVDRYVSAMDDAGRGDEVAAHLPKLEELARFATAHDARSDPPDHESRARAERALIRTRGWLGVAPRQRIELRRMMKAMRYGNTMSAKLWTRYDHTQLAGYLDRTLRAREAKRPVQETISWINPDNRVEYRVRTRKVSGSCASLTVAADLTRVVDAELGDMIQQVDMQFCQRREGDWRYGRS